jgi:hypothetical protein
LKGSAEKISAKQERVIPALLSKPTLKEAAEASGVSEVTLWRWLREPAFQSRYREARRDAVEIAVATMQSDCAVAVRTLREIAEDTEAGATARVQAAKAILEQSIEAVQLTDVLERLEAIEKLLAEPKE